MGKHIKKKKHKQEDWEESVILLPDTARESHTDKSIISLSSLSVLLLHSPSQSAQTECGQTHRIKVSVQK
jgi:hypothetical protein